MTTNVNATGAAGLTAERQAQRQALTEAVRAEFHHELGLPYGSHPKQILDVYRPKQTGVAPVFVFLHGGGFRNGSPGPMGFVGQSILEHGGMFVSMGYRLVPDARYPDSCDDVEHGLRWITQQIADRGGDPSRIYLSGHSAGATLAAAVALRPWSAEPGLPSDLIEGLALFSGFYDRPVPDPETENPESRRYVQFLTENIERIPPQTVIVSTDNDFPMAPENAEALYQALQKRSASVDKFVERDADHFAAVQGLASGDAVFEAVRGMMRLD
jgi:acetyl esterase/lipase